MNARVRARLSLLLLALLVHPLLAACDRPVPVPDRPPVEPAWAMFDQETAPLPATPKRKMRDPRGALMALDASASANATDAAAPVAVAIVVPPVPAVVTPVVATCGAKADPCPMQRFMHGAMATAHTPDTLTAAFTRVAGMSPDPTWAWVAIATRGADLANAGNVVAAKAQCKACHDVYEEPYRALHRARPL